MANGERKYIQFTDVQDGTTYALKVKNNTTVIFEVYANKYKTKTAQIHKESILTDTTVS